MFVIRRQIRYCAEFKIKVYVLDYRNINDVGTSSEGRVTWFDDEYWTSLFTALRKLLRMVGARCWMPADTRCAAV